MHKILLSGCFLKTSQETKKIVKVDEKKHQSVNVVQEPLSLA